jgi:hypothetical protein
VTDLSNGMLEPATNITATAGRPTSFSPREKAFGVALAAGALFVMAWIAMRPGNWGDWQVEARPAVDALVAGHVGRFLQLAPTYGGSLIMRAPLVLITTLWHGGEDAIFRASAVPCLAAAGALGLWLSARMRAKGASTVACLLTLLLCVANPLIFPALKTGHPEEILGAALCAAAVLCALDDRPMWAGVLLGLAIANKEWAVIAAGPVLVALPRARVRAMLVSGVTAGALMAPFILGSSGGFVGATTSAGLNAGPIFQPWQWWWFFGSHVHPAKGVHYNAAEIYRSAPLWIGRFGHTVPVAIVAPLTALYAWLRRGASRRRPHDALLLLALVLALRCVLDPWDISYYSLPCLFAIVSWESLGARRLPVASLTATFAAWVTLIETGGSALNLAVNIQALVFILASVPLVLALAVAVFAPGTARLLTRRTRPDAPEAVQAVTGAAEPAPAAA